MSRTSLFAVILLIVGLGTRLPFLGHPDQVVFDEVHFGKFINSYCCTQENFFDIHPPHAKLLIASFGLIGGYDGDSSFESISQQYNGANAAALRFLPAVAGGLLPIVLFGLLLHARVRSEYAFLGGLAIALDNAFVLQSRVISLDPILLLATFSALLAFFHAKKVSKHAWVFYVLSGVAAGLAVGTKFTGLVGLGLVGLLVLWEIGKDWKSAPAWAIRGVIIVASAAVVYVIGWVVHFSILTQPGPGDAWLPVSGDVIADTIEMHRIMLDANINLGATHPYASSWWAWPIMQRPVFYWVGANQGKLYLIGNPVVWWGGLVLFLLAVFSKLQAFAAASPRNRSSVLIGIFLVGYLFSYIPLARVPRVLFLYHYFTPLIFSILFGLGWLASDHQRLRSPSRSHVWIVATAIIFGFIVFSPLTYGFPAPAWQSFLQWFPSWI